MRAITELISSRVPTVAATSSLMLLTHCTIWFAAAFVWFASSFTSCATTAKSARPRSWR